MKYSTSAIASASVLCLHFPPLLAFPNRTPQLTYALRPRSQNVPFLFSSQASLSSSQCNSASYQSQIKSSIADLGGTAADVLCCEAAGCNWNAEVAASGKNISTFMLENTEALSGEDKSKDSDSSGASNSAIWHVVYHIIIGFAIMLN